MAKLKANCAGLQKKVAVLQDKIDNAGGDPLRKQKEKVASLQVCSVVCRNRSCQCADEWWCERHGW